MSDRPEPLSGFECAAWANTAGNQRNTMAYWLMKSEPDEFSIDDLAKAPKKTIASSADIVTPAICWSASGPGPHVRGACA